MTIKVSLTGFVIAAVFALIPLGIFLGFYFDQPLWFIMAVLAMIFFMAG